MRAVFLRGNTTVIDRPDPRPGPGEALVRVRLAGICGTDLELARGYMDFSGTPGHEFIGVVEEVEGSTEQKAAWNGRRVAAEINVGCRECEWCERGLARHCPSRTVIGILGRDGAHAERIVVPIGNLHEVPDAIGDREAVFIEPLAAACEILDQVTIAPGERVLIVGDGRLGQLIARLLKTLPCELLVLGRHRAKLALLDAIGIPTTLDGAGLVPGFAVVIEASGSPSGIYAAARTVRPRGTLVLKSTFSGERPLPIARLVVDEVTVVGSRCGRFESAIPLLASRSIQVDDLVSDLFPLDDAERAYERSAERAALKVLLQP